MNTNEKCERIGWVDVAKCFGIFMIYLGHFGSYAGRAYGYVTSFHTALFFFLAGCMETKNQRSFRENIKKKSIDIIIPFVFFASISLVIKAIQGNMEIGVIKENSIIIAKGAVRNQFFASGLWFLTCLFVMQILFSIIKKLKSKLLIFGACIALYLFAEKIMNPHPILEPSWFWNLDSAIYYIIFYAIGYLSFDKINSLLLCQERKCKWIVGISFAFSLVFCMCLFFGKDIIRMLWDQNEIIRLIYSVVKPLISIWMIIVISKICENVLLFKQIGANTLYLCGSEWVVRVLVSSFMALWNLREQLINPLIVYLYVIFLLYVANRFVVPVEKKIIARIKNIFVR